MAKPQIIKTPSGEELVVLSRAEFDALGPRPRPGKMLTMPRSMMSAWPTWQPGEPPSCPSRSLGCDVTGDSLLKALRDLEARRRKGTPEKR